MRRIHLALAALTLMSLAALPAQAAPGQAPGNPANDHLLTIGVVNVSKVFHNMQETKKSDADFHTQNDQLVQQQKQKEAEIQDLAKRRADFKPGSAQWQDVTNQIDQKSADLEVWVRVKKAQLERQFKLNMKTLYDHIAQATAEVAQQEHLNLVIADQSPEFIGPNLDAITTQRLDEILSARAVLYADKKADITDEVLTKVEANFANANRAAGIK
jgi:Skp family chaperone for outer membrane proteins